MSRNRAIWTGVRRPGTGLRSSRRDGRSRHDKPVKLNDMTIGNTVPHWPAHALPRYRDDPAPGGPIAWEAIFAADPVPEAGLHRQAAGLRGLPDT
jgi:hypothetical protein